MKISARQVKAAVDAYLRDRLAIGETSKVAIAPVEKSKRDEALRHFLDLMPEERDIVVHELRAKVRKGSYFISSPEIVEALLGRLAAGLTAD
jgi:anti-sigma28 factor (negative regulator of flagellin synthesis)